MPGDRDTPFAYESLSLLGKFSLRLSNKLVVSYLKPGSWLDILSGYNGSLQRSQVHNKSVTSFHSLDHSLNADLNSLGFHLKELYLDDLLPYNDDTFDNITIVNGLEHLWKPQDILSECYRVLREWGILQVIVPTWFGKPFLEFVAFRMNNEQAFREMNDHKTYYDERTLWPMLIKGGFQPKDVRILRVKLYCSLHAVAIKATK